MRKLMYGALALGAAVAVSFGAGAVDASAADTEFGVAADGDTLTITAASSGTSGQQTILVGEAKVQKKEYLKVSTWDVYDVPDSKKVMVDISKLSKTKDHFIQIKADYSNDVLATVKIEASDKLVAKYDKTKAEISVTSNKSDYPDGDLPFRTESGSEGFICVAGGKGKAVSIRDKDASGVAGTSELLPMYQTSGGTLYLQAPQSTLATVTAETGLKAGDYTLKKSEETHAPNLGGYTFKRASKEAKVTIGKLANAPKVKANYVKGEITVPKGAIFRYANSTAKGTFGTTALEAVKTLKLSGAAAEYGRVGTDGETVKDAVNASAEFAIQVQAPKTDKKPASKIGHFTFKKQDATLLAAGSVGDAADESGTKYISGNIVTAGKNTTLELKNETTAAAAKEFVVTYTKTGVTTATTTKLATGKTAKLTSIDLSKKIKIQEAGNAKDETWPGTEREFYAYSGDKPSTATAADKCLDEVVTVTDSRSYDPQKITVDSNIESVKVEGQAVTSAKKGQTVTIVLKQALANGGPSLKVVFGTTTYKATQTQFTLEFDPPTDGLTSVSSDSTKKTYTFVMPKEAVSIKVE